MYVILVYNPDNDPGRNEPRGVDPFAGIDVMSFWSPSAIEAERKLAVLKEEHPHCHYRLGHV